MLSEHRPPTGDLLNGLLQWIHDRVVTRGTIESRYPSLFPEGLPIGTVTAVEDPGSDTQEVRVRPFADLRRLENVQVLTDLPGGDR